jgi:amino acid adenylation domain-containing protein
MKTSTSTTALSRDQLDLLIRRLKARGPLEHAGAQAVSRRPSGAGPAPLSPDQERLWFLQTLDPGSPAYNLPAALRLRGELDRVALARSLREVVRRQEALRTGIDFGEGEAPVLRTLSVAEVARLAWIDLSGLPASATHRETARLAAAHARRPFGLSLGPLLRAALVDRGVDETQGGAPPRCHELLLSVHHVVADGWSIGIFHQELQAVYTARVEGLPPELPELPVRYGDFTAWQVERLRSGANEPSIEYWRERLRDAPVAELPADRPRPAEPSWRGERLPLALGPDLSDALRKLATAEGTTLFAALLAGYQLLVARATGEDDVVVGSVVAGRIRPEVERVVGFFANTLVLRTEVDGAGSFRDLVRRASATLVEALRHQEVPFARVLELAPAAASAGDSPFFRTLISMDAQGAGGFRLGAAQGEIEEISTGASKFDLSLRLVDRGTQVGGFLECSSDLFDNTTATRYVRHFVGLLGSALADPSAQSAHLAVWSPSERHQVLHDWALGAPLPATAATLHEGFREWARRAPDRVALTARRETLSYGELDRRSAALAARLRSLGVDAETRVGVCLERTPRLVVALLAVLRAGGAYVPLDPAYPRERIDLMVEDSGCRVLLTEGALRGRLPAATTGAGPELVALDEETATQGDAPAKEEWAGGSEELAYVIYTSGSTGRPKGVAITHRSASALVAWARTVFPPQELEGVLASTSVCFDLSVFELFVPLSAGGAVVLAADALELPTLPAAARVTLVNTVPSAMTELARTGSIPRSVRAVNLAGEPLLADLVRRVRAVAPAARVRNLYGPSEDTTYSTWAPADPEEPREPTIGRPVAGTRAVLLDARAEPVALGVPGELHLGGAGLSRGYLGRAALTAERFVPDPHAGAGAEPGARRYRTGDLARYLPDGRLEFLGRIDHQVKLRGFRIELGEVEAALTAQPEVERCAVVVHGEGADARLVAWVEGAEPAGDLAERLRGRLPAYMVPQQVLFLDALPLTPNGKVDRRALAGREVDTAAPRAEHVAPRTPAERLLAAAFAEVLDVERVGIHDGFFDLGGHSLRAARLAARIRHAFGVEVPLRRLFELRTVARLAQEIEAGELTDAAVAFPEQRVASPGDPGLPAGPFPTSFAQERLWFLDRLDGASATYNLAGAVRLRGWLRAAALAAALSEVARRHQALRSTFGEVDDAPVQWIGAAAPVPLPWVDLAGLAPGEAEEETGRLALREAARPFDLEAGPLLRCTLVRRSAAGHTLLVTLHHIVSDGWSLGVMVRELQEIYAARARGAAHRLEPLPLQYPEVARAERLALEGEPLAALTRFWRAHLDGAGPVDLPADRPRPACPSGRGGSFAVSIDEERTRRLRELARREGATPFVVLAAAFQALLARYTGRTDVAIGFPAAHRERPETDRLIGLFVNTLVLRTDLSRDPSFRDLVALAGAATFDALAHQELPFDRIVGAAKSLRGATGEVAIDVLFALQNVARLEADLPELAVELAVVPTGTAKFELTVELVEEASRLSGTVTYATDRFDRATIRGLWRRFERLLEAAVAAPERRLSGLPLLAPAERHAVVVEWSTGAGAPPAPVTLAERFERMAAATPDATAVVARGRAFSYGELERRSRAVARRLAARGVGPGRRVAVFLERSPDLVAALLGVLRAGGAFVALDPAYPPERLAFMLEDSGAAEVISRAELGSGLPEREGGGEGEAGPLLLPAAFRATEDRAPRPGVPAAPGDLAYLIYTSGSTGRPKAVAIEHRSAAARVDWALLAFGRDELDGVLASTSVCFDLSVFELFVPLAAGGRVVLVDDALDLAGHPEAERVTLLNTVPSAIAELVRLAAIPRSVRVVNLAGEPLKAALVARIHAAVPAARILDLYGPSEDTTYSTCGVVDPGEGREPAIGRPLTGTRTYVVDAALRPVPATVPGELYLGGAGLSRGYHARPGLTAERYRPDPFARAAHDAGGRLYRTGDLARHRPDGRLEFLGRLDHQVKVRGFRIELGEVEAVLESHPAVAESAVLVRGEGANARLVAFVALHPPLAGGAEGLQPFLRERLPAPMVPSVVEVLEAFPRTPNGKVDRRALAAHEVTAPAAASTAPSGAMEEAVAKAFQEVLGLPRVGAEDDFFALGGHSLLATRLVSRLRRDLGVELHPRQVFERRTVRGLAAAADRVPWHAAPPVVPRAPRPGAGRPLSFAQERLWFLDRITPGGATYNVPCGVWVEGRLDPPALAATLSAVVGRHEVLRSRFEATEDGPVQVVGPPRPLALPVVDLAALPADRRTGEALRVARTEALRPFDLERSEPARALLVAAEPDRSLLLFTMHHVVSDGWSVGVLLRELSVLYPAYAAGEPSPLPQLPVQYADVAAWQRAWMEGAVLDRLLAYWRPRLMGLPPLDLPTDRPRTATAGLPGGRIDFRLPAPLREGVEHLAASRRATPFMVLLAAFAALLARHTGQDDVAVGAPIANRTSPGAEALIGLFANPLVLRSDLSGRPTFDELLARTRELCEGAYAHQELPFERLVEELAPARMRDRNPLFDVMLVLQNEPFSPELPGVRLEPVDLPTGRAKFDLSLVLYPQGDGFAGTWEFRRELFDRTTVERLRRRFETLLAACLEMPRGRIGALPMLSPGELHEVLEEWMAGPAACSEAPPAALPAWLAEVAQRAPDRLALEWPGGSLSYGGLCRRVFAVARDLRRHGVAPEVPVAVFLERSVEAVVALLAAFEAGGICLPLDPAYPDERLTLMLADARPRLAVTAHPLGGRLADLAAGLGSAAPGIVTLPLGGTPPEGWEDAPAAPQPEPSAGAYLVYTSGSTGRPKGVLVSHAAAAAHFHHAARAYRCVPTDRALLFSAVGFDVALEELFAGLASGATLCLWPPREFSGRGLSRFLRAHRVTLLNLPTAAWVQWLHEAAEDGESGFEDLRLAVVGGEVMPAAAARRFRRRIAPHARLVNAYGPTEAVVTSALYGVTSDPAGDGGVPIGRPLGRDRAQVRDAALAPAPVGVPGELLLGGPGLARGYLGSAARTAACFVPDPSSGRSHGAAGDRVYRTGDLVRWLPNGTLEFLGRADRQVKVRGFRIELGEVEAALAEHPDLDAAVVVLRKGAHEPRLAAYAVPSPGSAPTPDDLRRHLAVRLPAFMVPADLVLLDALPLDPNGKVDRRALPEPEPAARAGIDDVLPRTPAEELVARVFGRLLKRRPLPLERSFFELGGHSLLAARAAARLRRELGRDVPLQLLFERPTVRSLAAALGELPESAFPALEPRGDGGGGAAVPLSFSQERLSFLDRYEPDSPQYAIPGGLRLSGRLRAGALAGALTAIVARHEVLRTRFEEHDGESRQRVEPVAAVPLTVVDLSALPAERRQEALERWSRREAARPFDLGRPPLLRATLGRLGPEEHALVVVMHHIVSDGWSFTVLARELAALYRAAVSGTEPGLPPLPVQYLDYAAWQRQALSGEARKREIAFWRERLTGVPALELPADRPRPPVRSGRGETIAVALPAGLTRELEAFGRAAGASLFHGLMSAFQAVLARWSGQADFAVGTPVANRNRPEVEDLVGFFVNTLALRAQPVAAEGFGALLRRVRGVSVEAMDHQELPLDVVVEALAPERDPSRTPLFQVVLGFVNEPAVFELPGLRVEPFEVPTGTAKFDLTVNLYPDGDRIAGTVERSADLFDRTTAERLWRHLSALLVAGLAEPDRPIGTLPLMAPAERHQVVAEWAGWRSGYPRDATLPELFARQVERRPDAVAVELDAVALTYGELSRRVGRLAARLFAAGVGPDVPVGLLLERSPEMIIATLAVVEAGSCYAPLDPGYPRERLERMLAEANAPVVLAHRHLAERFPGLRDGAGEGFRGTVIELDGTTGAVAPDGPAAPPRPSAGPDSLAYVMYTSGSTGRPKGVAVAQRAVARLVQEADFARLDPEETFLQLAPTPFDAATLEIWGPLTNGGRLVLMPPGPVGFGELGRVLVARRVTTLWLTAGLFQRMVEEELPSLAGVRQLLAGGDVLPPHPVRRVLCELPGVRVINGYGPTENTTFTTCFPMASERDLASPVPIGRPIADTAVVLLDRHHQVVPVGVPGALHAAGDGLARGYLGRPAATAAAFVPHPGSPEPGARAYRTGDLARWRHDGTIEFLGRLDGQVKLRGFRIELGEVETVLAAHPEVEAAVAVVRADEEGEKRLLAYAVVSAGATVTSDHLRDHLAGRLPAFMVPADVVLLDALPLDPNGKVDRHALPEPGPARVAGTDVGRARTPAEELVARVFADTLKVGAVPLDESFFDLGGHSLAAGRAASRLRRELDREVPLRLLFERPTVRGLAAALGELAESAGPPLRRLAGEDARQAGLPLSFAQERLWFLDRYEPGSAQYAIPGGLRLSGALRADALARALSGIVERHEALRTRFEERGGEARQWVEPPAAVALPVVDLSALPGARRDAALAALGREEAARPFDLGRPPLLRAALARLAAEDHALVVVMHHIVSDGWSFTVLARELTALYRGAASDPPAELPPLPVQYPDFAVWQRRALSGAAREREVAYWRERLAGVPALELPADRPRPPARSGRGEAFRVALPAPVARAVAGFARAAGASPFHVLMAAFQAVLGRCSGQEDFAVGMPVANRTRAEVEDLVGFFVNTLALRARPEAGRAFGTLVRGVRQVAVEAMSHQDLPLELLVEALAPEREPSRTPLFQVVLGFVNEPAVFELAGLRVEPFEVAGGTAKFDLAVNLRPEGEGIGGAVELSADLFDRTTVERLWRHLATLLAAGLAEPARPIGELPLLTRAEAHQALVELAGNRSAYPRDATLADLFARQVAARPHAVAVELKAAALTYGELSRRAGRLGQRLRAAGVAPGAVVGLCFERGLELIVATLGALHAGAAYLPLDPSYPPERLAFMIEDSGAAVVVAGPETTGALPAGVRVLPLPDAGEDADGATVAPSSVHPLASANVIYTSGSTGRPKGVLVTHRGVVRLVVENDHLRVGPGDRMGFGSNIAFDAATLEIWSALGTGGCLVGIEREVLLDPRRLADHLAARRLSVAFLTTALFNQVARAVPDAFAALSTVAFGGEAADPRAAGAVLRAGAPGRLLNLYGPAENATLSTGYRLVEVADSAAAVPIGGPVANSSVHLLDRRLRPVPAGVPGGIFVGGDGLATGYLGRPALSAERFVPHPFSEAPGGRLYATGDLARRRPRDGALDFLGREDHQVKIRGFRVEPDEVASVLARHPGLAEAVVVVREDAPGERRLVAYGVAAEGAEPVPAALRDHLRAELPQYMIPSAFVILDALPLTPNGKLDRRALPAPGPNDGAPGGSVAPRTPMEELVAGVYADVLGTTGVGAHDGFFELGGHSLLAVRVASRLGELVGGEVPLKLLFEHPTVAGLAAAVAGLAGEGAGAAGGAPPLVRRERPDGVAPLSYSQERLWILDRIEPGSTTYGIPVAVRLRGAVALGALARALSRLVARHEALRTRFGTAAGRPIQRIVPPRRLRLPVVDLGRLAPALTDRRRGEVLDAVLESASERTFDLERGPLLRTLWIREGDGAGVLHVLMHHIVSDGWSVGVLVRETAELYRAEVEAVAPALPKLPVQYADFARWQREWLGGETRGRQLAYWRERLEGAPPASELPMDRPRPAVRSFVGRRASAWLDPERTAALRRLAGAERATLFMVLLAGFALLLQRLSGQDDVVVGSPVAGRGRREVEGLIGMFLNTLVLRTELSGDPSFRELLRRVRGAALGAYAHQDVPFEMLLDELKPERDLSRTPFFQVFLNMLELPMAGGVELPGAVLEPVSMPEAPSKFDLTLYLGPRDGGLALDAVFDAGLFERATVERFLDQYLRILDQAVAAPERRIGAVSLLDPASLAVLPDPRVELGAAWHGSIHAALARAARETPDRLAVVDPERAWTYAALEARAAALAGWLRRSGVERGDRVALFSHRSAPLAAAVLGTLHAGAAFVILDPAYPAQRLVEMVEVARPRALLALAQAGEVPAELLAALDGIPRRTVGADDALDQDPPPPAEVGPDDPAYVAFTSGSTGRAKGILGRHGSLTHFLPWQCRRFGLGADDRFSMLSGLAHDPLHRDLFTPLWLGAAVVVPDPREMGAAGRLARWLERERVTAALLTPAMAQVVTQRSPAGPSPRAGSLARVFLVGDVLTVRDVERLRSLAPGVTCVNLYGSTETQRAVAFHELPPGRAVGAGAGDAGRQVLPLGRGMVDVQLLVVNRGGGLCAVGEVGEVCVRSPHLALGYLDDPELTARRFTANPLHEDARDRVYRTGDLGRYRPDGEVVFLGRADDQVKVRGFRIELGEVQASLAAVPGVREAAVLLKTDGPGGPRLVGYVVPEPGAPRPSASDLRSALQARLPAYMVPSGFAVLDRIPLTPNRKIDRRALARVGDSSREVLMSSRPPQTRAEKTIAEIVREVLGLDTMRVEDNFFDLGGNSLLLVDVHGRLEAAFGRTIPMVALFNHPTVQSLAAYLSPDDERAAGGPAGEGKHRLSTSELKAGRNRLKDRRQRIQG